MDATEGGSKHTQNTCSATAKVKSMSSPSWLGTSLVTLKWSLTWGSFSEDGGTSLSSLTPTPRKNKHEIPISSKFQVKVRRMYVSGKTSNQNAKLMISVWRSWWEQKKAMRVHTDFLNWDVRFIAASKKTEAALQWVALQVSWEDVTRFDAREFRQKVPENTARNDTETSTKPILVIVREMKYSSVVRIEYTRSGQQSRIDVGNI